MNAIAEISSLSEQRFENEMFEQIRVTDFNFQTQKSYFRVQSPLSVNSSGSKEASMLIDEEPDDINELNLPKLRQFLTHGIKKGICAPIENIPIIDSKCTQSEQKHPNKILQTEKKDVQEKNTVFG